QPLPQSLAAQQLVAAAPAMVAVAAAPAMVAVAAAPAVAAAAVNNLKYRPTIQSAATYFFLTICHL
ncbi:MAG: hypothetical protein ACJ71F_17445, partial [Nitrososphaeraceae archaeon]